MKTIKTASPSRLAVYEQCPLHAQLKFGERIPDPNPHPAAERGTQIHQEAEDYVRGKSDDLRNLLKFKEEFEVLRALYAQGKVSLEGEWGYNEDWEVVDYAQAWLRMKCDAIVWLSKDKILIIDYKTGKRFGNEVKHGEQTLIYAAGTVARYAKVENIITELWYLDQDELAPAKYTRKSALTALARYDMRMKKMTQAKVFPANPNPMSCKYCPYKKTGTGHCPHGV